jgi:hypothetical protein
MLLYNDFSTGQSMHKRDEFLLHAKCFGKCAHMYFHSFTIKNLVHLTLIIITFIDTVCLHIPVF